MTRQRRPRAKRLEDAVQVALEVRDLYENQVVQRWISTERERLLIQIQETASIDGDQCRVYALELKALNTLAAKTSGVVQAGDIAAKELAKMDNQDG